MVTVKIVVGIVVKGVVGVLYGDVLWIIVGFVVSAVNPVSVKVVV